MKKTILCILLIIIIFIFAGCQTVEGLGGDIQWMGQAGADVLEGE